MKSLIAVTLVFYSALTLSAGVVQTAIFNSKALGVSKSYKIYLPEGYEETKRNYPVIYQLHGWGATEASWTSPELNIQGKADALQLEAIIVMPDGDRSMYVNSNASVDFELCMNQSPPRPNLSEPRSQYCVKMPRYESYVVDDLIPHIDVKYRTVADRKGRAISGESMGGFGAMQLAMRHPQKFSSVVSHSGLLSLLYDGPRPFEAERAKTLTSIVAVSGRKEVEDSLGYSIQRWRAHDPYSLLGSVDLSDLEIYFDCGSVDEVGAYEMALHFEERLTELGVAYTFVPVQGGHHDDELFSARVSHGLRFHLEHFKSKGVYHSVGAN